MIEEKKAKVDLKTCPICKNKVQAFNQLSHAIPRWMFSQIKQNGQAVFSAPNLPHVLSQSDPKAKIVCDECEKRFSYEDRFAVQFFRNKRFFISESKHRNNEGIVNTIQTHNGIARPDLTAFVLGVLLRWELILISKKESTIIGEDFERLRLIYLSKTVSELIGMKCNYYRLHTGMIVYPKVINQEGYSCHLVSFLGYEFRIHTDIRFEEMQNFYRKAKEWDIYFYIYENSENELSRVMNARAKITPNQKMKQIKKKLF